MQANDVQKFRDLMVGMGRMFGVEVDSLVLDAYWLAMKNWDLCDFQDAAALLMQKSKFMPKPADFNELRKAGEVSAGEAFAKAMDVARQCSAYGGATSDDERVDAAARSCGGYFAMGQVETSKIGFLERRFAEHYEAISDKSDTREALPHIVGDQWRLLTYMKG